MASATLSRSEFDAACRAFAARDPAGGVAWAWVDETPDAPFGPRPGFLRSAALLVPPPREHAAASADATAETAADAECTDEAELADAPARAHRLELHVAYSHTYSVPLLLLQGYDADGAPWTDSAVNAHLSGCCKGAPLPPGAVTQTMHPSLDAPYYCVHPCHTAERMGHLLRFLQVVKMRGTPHSRAKHSIELTQLGVMLTPMLKWGAVSDQKTRWGA